MSIEAFVVSVSSVAGRSSSLNVVSPRGGPSAGVFCSGMPEMPPSLLLAESACAGPVCGTGGVVDSELDFSIGVLRRRAPTHDFGIRRRRLLNPQLIDENYSRSLIQRLKGAIVSLPDPRAWMTVKTGRRFS